MVRGSPTILEPAKSPDCWLFSPRPADNPYYWREWPKLLVGFSADNHNLIALDV